MVAPIFVTNGDQYVIEGTAFVVNLEAIGDPDFGPLQYSIDDSGFDWGSFTLDPATRALRFKNAPDFESPNDSGGDNTYKVNVVASYFNGDTTLTITVTVLNDFNPVFQSDNTFTLLENTLTVGTVTASDPDGAGAVTYAIGGTAADAAQFTIDEQTGVLSFIDKMDFDQPADAGQDNIYEVDVIATDATGETTEQLILVTIADNIAPVISSPDTATVQEGTTLVLTVTATDADTQGALTYALFGGADKAVFTINEETGQLSFSAAPDFENPADHNDDNRYNVVVSVTDAKGESALQSIDIKVTDNQSPIFTSSATITKAENKMAVGTVVAKDPELAGAVTYAITGGADSAFFQINSNSGGLIFSVAPDAENPLDDGTDNTYNLTVTATDANGETATQAITVTVTDNGAPTFTGTSTPSVREGTKTVMTVTATDPENAGGLSFAISGGNDGDLFTIDASSGVLSFLATPDFEDPRNAVGQANRYVVAVRVTDLGGETAENVLLVDVTDSQAPTFSSSANLTVSENTTAVTTVVATDPDALGPVSYAITGGFDKNFFKIDADTGELSFVSAPDFENQKDQGLDNTYTLTVTATDIDGETTKQDISVLVINNVAPLITSTDEVSVREGNTTVMTVTATDPESAGPLAFALAGGDDSGLFSIDSQTGVLSFLAAPDYENPLNGSMNVYVVRVKVTDAGGESVAQTLGVEVTDSQPPLFISSDRTTVNENQTAVMTVEATDPESAGAITYSITGGDDKQLFNINAKTGVLSFELPPDYDVPSDADFDRIYSVIVTATDADGETTTQALQVEVGNIDEPPLFTSGDSPSVVENSTTVTTVTAVDPEATGALTYGIDGGADAALFAINKNTGVLTFKSAPDFETKADADTDGVYELVVIATDYASKTSTQALLITVTNVNEAPVFSSSATLSVAENSTAVTTVSASDPEAQGQVVYSISGGADADLFTLSLGGTLSFKAAPDFETKADADHDGVYVVEVTAEDQDVRTSTQTLQITVTDIDETPSPPPQINLAPTKVAVTLQTLTEGPASAKALAVGSISVTDDGIGTNALSLTGTDAARFQITGTTLELRPGVAIDYETTKSLSLTVVVDDKTLGTQPELTQAVTIPVVNLNEAPVVSRQPDPVVARRGETLTIDLGALVKDPDAGDAVTFAATKLLPGLSLDAATGILSGAPERATKGEQTLTVTATDQAGLSATVSLAITVDGNRAPVWTAGPSHEIDVSADVAPRFVSLANLLGITDADADPLTFRILQGASLVAPGSVQIGQDGTISQADLGRVVLRVEDDLAGRRMQIRASDGLLTSDIVFSLVGRDDDGPSDQPAPDRHRYTPLIPLPDLVSGSDAIDTLVLKLIGRIRIDLDNALAFLRAEVREVALQSMENVILQAGSRGFIKGSQTDNTFVAHGGVNVFHGLGGDDTLMGGLGLDRMFGGSGDDLLVSVVGRFRDFLKGGAGADVFRVLGEVRIRDFLEGIDALDLRRLRADREDLELTARGDDLVITHDDSRIVLDGLVEDGINTQSQTDLWGLLGDSVLL